MMARIAVGFGVLALLACGTEETLEPLPEGWSRFASPAGRYEVLVPGPPEELVQLTFGDGRTSFTNPLWEGLRDRQDVLSGAFAFSSSNFNLANGGEERNVQGYLVSGDFFRTLGVMPVLGRLLTTCADARFAWSWAACKKSTNSWYLSCQKSYLKTRWPGNGDCQPRVRSR